MPTTFLALLARALLQAIGGALVARGAIDADAVTLLTGETMTGAAAIVLGLGWSYAQKKGLTK